MKLILEASEFGVTGMLAVGSGGVVWLLVVTYKLRYHASVSLKIHQLLIKRQPARH